MRNSLILQYINGMFEQQRRDNEAVLERQRQEHDARLAQTNAKLARQQRESNARIGELAEQLNEPRGTALTGAFKDSRMPPPTLSSTDVAEVDNFYNRFQASVRHNKWSHCRARDELYGAIQKDIAVFIEDIPRGTRGVPDGDVEDWEELLELYRKRLVNEETQRILQAEVEMMVQDEDETLMQWYGRSTRKYKAAFAAELRRLKIECYE